MGESRVRTSTTDGAPPPSSGSLLRDGWLRHSSRTVRGWVFGAAIAVQLLVLYLPRVPSEPHIEGQDALIHLLVFAAVMYTGLRFGLGLRLLLIVLSVHAVLSEVIQHLLLANRTGDWHDVIADLIGVAFAHLVYRAR